MEGRFLSPPEALELLKTFGFNLLSLSNNHSWDFKVSGIENTLAQVKRLDLAHAGIGHTVEEAVAPGYLRTPKGTVALVAMASGLIPDGGAATATRPGVKSNSASKAPHRTPRMHSAFCRASAPPGSEPISSSCISITTCSLSPSPPSWERNSPSGWCRRTG